MLGALLKVQMCLCVADARDSARCHSEQNIRFCSSFKTDSRRGPGTCQEDLERCIYRGRRSTRDMLIREFGGQGAVLLRRVAFRSIRSSGLLRWSKVVLHDRCKTSYDLALLFCVRHNASERSIWKIAKPTGTRPSALHPSVHYWRQSRRIASFLMLPTSKINNGRNLSELLRVQACRQIDR